MSSSSRQRSIIRHPHDYNGAVVEGAGPNRQSITVEYAYARDTVNFGATSPTPSRPQRASYAPSVSRNTPPRSGSPTRVRNSLHKPPPSSARKLSKEPNNTQILESNLTPTPPPVMEDYSQQSDYITSPSAYANPGVPPRPSRANTETLQDLYTPDVAAFSESNNTNTIYDRRASLPALPTDEDAPFVADMHEALPSADPIPSGHRSRSGTTSQSKPKKGGMLSFMSGVYNLLLGDCDVSTAFADGS